MSQSIFGGTDALGLDDTQIPVASNGLALDDATQTPSTTITVIEMDQVH